MPNQRTAPSVLAFDVYGTLVDPARISEQLHEFVPAKGSLVAQIWRQKQLELTFRLTIMERYENFEWVTAKALDYALATTHCELTTEQKGKLLAHYDQLPAFPDALEGLRQLQLNGHRIVAFSNGTPRMLKSVLHSAGLEQFFEGVVSADEVHAYKPAPKVYRHVAQRSGVPSSAICLISSNPFDVVGALAVGMQAVWVNRSGEQLFDPLDKPPPITVRSLTALPAAVADH
jgi:2-haloacid dehalogenase